MPATPTNPILHHVPPADLVHYLVHDDDRLLTPALLVYPERVAANIDAMLRLVAGDAGRWRPHLKTLKLESMMRMLVMRGVRQAKCATTLESRTALAAGFSDVLVASPVAGAGARRVRAIADAAPHAAVAVLIENEAQCADWAGSRVGAFLDLNPGMDRTGMDERQTDAIIALARAVAAAHIRLAGIHYYDGHVTGRSGGAAAETLAHAGYERLLGLVATLHRAGIAVPEVVTAGTNALTWSLSHHGLAGAPFVHRVSPGTLVYNDAQSLAELPPEAGFAPAVAVLATVISQPAPGRITCDAGHKSISADAGVPGCTVIGQPGLEPARPSEEHLPLDAALGRELPAIGDRLYLLPRHVCPTVNNFDHALLVAERRVQGLERVGARGHESPLG